MFGRMGEHCAQGGLEFVSVLRGTFMGPECVKKLVGTTRRFDPKYKRSKCLFIRNDMM